MENKWVAVGNKVVESGNMIICICHYTAYAAQIAKEHNELREQARNKKAIAKSIK